MFICQNRGNVTHRSHGEKYVSANPTGVLMNLSGVNTGTTHRICQHTGG